MNNLTTKRLFIIYSLLFLISVVSCSESAVEPTLFVPTKSISTTPVKATQIPSSKAEAQSSPIANTDPIPEQTKVASPGDVEIAVTPVATDQRQSDGQDQETKEYYQINFVEEDDFLNVRQGSGVEFPVVAALPPGTTGLEINGEGRWVSNSLWLPVQVDDIDGWVNSRFLTESLSRREFCSDVAGRQVAEQFLEIVRKTNGRRLSSLVEEGRGLRIRRHWWNQEVLLEKDDLALIFTNNETIDWGVADGSGKAIKGSFMDVIYPLLEDNLLPATEMACDEILHGGTAGFVRLPVAYEGINYYSYFRPPAPGNNELDWGTWVIGIEKWQGEYRLSFLIHYEWEI